MIKKGQQIGCIKEIFGIILKKRSSEKHLGWKIVIFGDKCQKEGHREFGVPENVILPKKPW